MISTTQAAGPRLHVETTGKGPVVVLLPPVGLGGWVWRPVTDRVAERRTVAAVDLPGFGSPSLPVGTPWTVERFTDAVAGFLRTNWPGRVDVAGVSLGGAVALELARRRLVHHALAVSPIGFWTATEARYAVTSLRATQLLARLSRPVQRHLARSPAARTLLLAQTVGHPRQVPADAAQAMARNVADAPLAATFPHTGRYHFAPSDGMGEGITIAWGTHDRLLPPRQAQRARQALPAAHHVELPGAGHVPFWDTPDQLAELVLDPTP